MTLPEPDGFAPASEALVADLVPRDETSAKRTLRTVLNLVGGMFLDDHELGHSNLDLVVTRRDTGAAVLRVAAGTPTEASYLIDRVKTDLATKSIEDFLSEWR
ncbi:hypothetical protein [Microbacterium sp. NPDC064584]|uniref:hypothetical protein n=1 Tax=Microbacterium sp. NPDC064584 TaxID=3155817 RepID=UPI0034166A2A